MPLALLGIEDALSAIVCFLSKIAGYFLVGIVDAVNLVIRGLGNFIGLLIEKSPDLPQAPANIGARYLGVANWFAPIGYAVVVAGTLVALYVAVLLIRIPFRWVKAL